MNNFERYKELSDNNPDVVVGFNKAIEKAFAQKDYKIIKYILTSPELIKERKIYKEESIEYRRFSLEEFTLIFACDNNCKDMVEFIFTNKNVDKEFLYRSLNYGLTKAASKGALEVVQYLTTSYDLKNNADINYVNSPLKEACQHGNLNVVKFLLDSPLLEKKADLSSIENIYDFSFLCRDFISENNSQHMPDNEKEKNDYLDRKMLVLKYLILEQNFKTNEDIEKFLQKPENKIIKRIFDTRELQNELNENLNKNVTKKPKI